MSVVFLIGAFQSLFFATFLLTKKENKRANIILGIWLLTVALFFVENWVNFSGTYKSYPFLSGLFSGTPFLYGPFLWLYSVFITRPSRLLKWQDVLHFAPMVIYYLFASLVFFSMDAEPKIEMMDAIIQGSEVPNSLKIWGFLKSLHGLVYIAFTINYLSNYQKQIPNHFSNLDRINLKWLKHLSTSFLLIYIIAFIGGFGLLLNAFNIEGVLGILSVLIILMIAFQGLRQGQLFSITPVEESEKIKYLHSRLQKQDISILKNQIANYLEAEKPFLNAEYRLKDLAEALEVHPNDLSQAINEGFNQNFFTLINKCRVEEVKDQLKDPKNNHLTLLAIGLDAGFNSKTTFNTVFKKVTGKTPSQFRKESLIN